MQRLNLDYRQDHRLSQYSAYFLLGICALIGSFVFIHYISASTENANLSALIDKVEGVSQPNASAGKQSQYSPEAQKDLILFTNQVIN